MKTERKTDKQLLIELWVAANTLLDYLDPDSVIDQKDNVHLRIARETAQANLEELCEELQFSHRVQP